MDRAKVLLKMYDLALMGNVPAARLLLREPEEGEEEVMSTGQILALVRQTLKQSNQQPSGDKIE